MTRSVQLGEVITLRKGKKAAQVYDARVNGALPYIQIDEVRGSTPQQFACDPKGVEVELGDLCIVWDGANAGTVGYGIRGLIGSTVSRLRLVDRNRWDTRFIGHLLQSKFIELNGHAQGRGATIPHVDKSRLEAIELPAIDKHEQERIAAILDKADGIRRGCTQGLTLANNLLRATFLAMFGDLETNQLGWETKSLEELLITDPQNGLYRPAQDYGSGVNILRIDGFYEGYIVKDKPFKRLRIDGDTIRKYRLSEGDIVINRVNSREYLGKSALVEELHEETVFESNMMRFRVDDRRIVPRFLVDQLQTAFIKRQILRASKDAVNQSSINQTDVRNFIIRVPPMRLQRRYVSVVAWKNRADERLHETLNRAEDLFGSLSQRAFRGEL
jgi:type I restriction enzyme S subunit